MREIAWVLRKSELGTQVSPCSKAQKTKITLVTKLFIVLYDWAVKQMSRVTLAGLP